MQESQGQNTSESTLNSTNVSKQMLNRTFPLMSCSINHSSVSLFVVIFIKLNLLKRRTRRKWKANLTDNSGVQVRVWIVSVSSSRLINLVRVEVAFSYQLQFSVSKPNSGKRRLNTRTANTFHFSLRAWHFRANSGFRVAFPANYEKLFRGFFISGREGKAFLLFLLISTRTKIK